MWCSTGGKLRRKRKLICFCDGFYRFSGELGRLKECDREMRETEKLRCDVEMRGGISKIFFVLVG